MEILRGYLQNSAPFWHLLGFSSGDLDQSWFVFHTNFRTQSQLKDELLVGWLTLFIESRDFPVLKIHFQNIETWVS